MKNAKESAKEKKGKWTALKNPLSPEQEEQLSSLLGDELLPKMRRLAAEHAFWQQYHDDEPPPAEAVKQLKKFAHLLKSTKKLFLKLPLKMAIFKQ